MRISQKVKDVLMWNLQHSFHMKTKIFTDFQICISVPLTNQIEYIFAC